MRRTAGRLADGREIIWFDARVDAVRDARHLPPTSTTSQMRCVTR